MARHYTGPVRWIGYALDPRQEHGVFVFRRAHPGAWPMRISADQGYRLYCDGRLIAEGPPRGDLKHWPVETVDLPPGEQIHAVVWSFGRLAALHRCHARLGLLVEEPEGWEVARLPGYDFAWGLGDPGPAFSAVGPGEILDVSVLPPWEELGKADLDWQTPHDIGPGKPRGAGGHDSAWWLIDALIPPRQRAEELSLQISESGLIDLGELRNGWPRLELQGTGAALITYAEALVDGEGHRGNRHEKEGKGCVGFQDRAAIAGKGTFEPLEWRCARFIQIDTTNDVRVVSASWQDVESRLQPDAELQADEETERIWTTAIRTAKLCAVDAYDDCPYWERLQYAGDARIQALIGYHLSPDRSLQRQAIRHFAWSQMPDGLTASRYPDRTQQVIPPFSLWWVLMIHDNWMHDEPEFALGFLDQAQCVLDWWQQEEQDEHWPFADWVPGWEWGVPPGGLDSVIHRLTLLWAELAVAQMAGDEALKESARTEWRSLNLEAEPRSEHAEALYRVVGGALGESAPAWPELPNHAPRCTYYFSWYAHLARHPGDYRAELQPWRDMLDLGLTTFAEMPEPTRSDCHAWSAHPILGLCRLAAGVESIAPGWSRCRIAPNPHWQGPLRVTIPHPKGPLTAERQEDAWLVECPVPWIDGDGQEHAPGDAEISAG